MKYLLFLVLFVGAMLGAACDTTANNATNMRGTNTNTGYVMNSNTTVKPSMPANATNISPPSMNSVVGNSNNSNLSGNRKGNVNSNANGVKK